jgi:hypothetical protein
VAEAQESITLQSYTHARTHPWVVGKVGGARLPWQLSPAQVAVLVGSFILLLKTRGLWAHMGAIPNLMVQAVIPLVLTWCMRHMRMEGRSPGRMLLGIGSYLWAPNGGRTQGRPWREPRATTLTHARIFMLTNPAPVEHRAPSRRNR